MLLAPAIHETGIDAMMQVPKFIEEKDLEMYGLKFLPKKQKNKQAKNKIIKMHRTDCEKNIAVFVAWHEFIIACDICWPDHC